ncbi:disulfide bond formation protein DsbB [Camelimonas fluminis]|uniref:Disulfide bond formation protein B n=1 Tax=Camelimonas fluminis TaxID=1576911 RepID=A0ABV7UMM8_9HYPH|nr:disulfide bond formation protein B [Camelimonas fluminis]GHE64885.1 disulfide bond formation protein DsbB [Camelimonas fluminis]
MLARMSISRCAALIVMAVALAVIATFLFFEHILGYLPCPLCLQQRLPWYFGAPLAALIAATPEPQKRLRGVGLLLLALVFLISAGLGAYHAGVEWKFWPGPPGCSGQGSPTDAANLLNQLQSIRIVSCTDAAWRLFGLSMAGWNVLVSLALTAVAGAGAMRVAQSPGGRRHAPETAP